MCQHNILRKIRCKDSDLNFKNSEMHKNQQFTSERIQMPLEFDK